MGNRKKRWELLFAIPVALILTIGWLYANRIVPKAEQEAAGIAVDSYIYGYPLVTTKITELAFINTVKPSPASFQAPINQLVSQPEYPPATYHGVTAPNADTLYSAGFLDLSKEPVVLSYPDMGNRYFLFPIYDAWTTVIHSAGLRTSGGTGQHILIAGPSWRGKLPAGTRLVQSHTNTAFIIGRVYSDGTPGDLAQVHALQAQFKLTPLSAYGKPYTPPPGQSDGKYEPSQVVRDVIAQMSGSEYFTFLSESLRDNPSVLPRDAMMVAKMAKIGIVPGKPFDMSHLSSESRRAIEDAPRRATAILNRMEAQGLGKIVNGWQIPGVCGKFGENYRIRAVVSDFGWGCNLPQDAVYPIAKIDDAGNALTGSRVYTIHFNKDEMPPVEGFWSITMYDKQYYFYANALNKLTVSPRNKFRYNADGSLDLYFSHVRPAPVAEANWLPAPADDFILCMRLYWPRTTPPSILPPSNPSWTPPPIKEVVASAR